MQRRTRIVATLGPATDPPAILAELLTAGIDVVRINFSHGTPDEHLTRIARLREAARERIQPVAVLADLPGPKLRAMVDEAISLQIGSTVSLAASATAAADIPVTEPELIAEVEPGHRILLDDGRIRLRAARREKDYVAAEVEVGGELSPRKGVNLPDTRLSAPALTPRDREALKVAAEAGVDWIALSFVRSAQAATELRQAVQALGLQAPIIAKIERPEAVENADSIIAAFDGIMVARGDLGVELPLEEVPSIQKYLIRRARAAARPVITATEMLDSMRFNPRPTRAEASDVANAIYDGTDALMLSGETAVGNYPAETVHCMNRIIRATESEIPTEDWAINMPLDHIDDQIAQGACALAQAVHAQAIITPTYSGRTSRMVAQLRPRSAIISTVADPAVRRQLALIWGVTSVPLSGSLAPGEDRIDAAVRAAFEHRVVREGNLVTAIAEHPIEGGSRMPTVRVVRVGNNGESYAP